MAFRLLNFFSKAFLVIGPMPLTESSAEYLFVLLIFFLDAVIANLWDSSLNSFKILKDSEWGSISKMPLFE